MAKKTLLLVFIHGFKGGDKTFQNFPKDLSALLQHSLPTLDVVEVAYPPYETRGDLGECVNKFTEWLQNKVIDLEAANRTPAPTINPSVRVVLCGHSMGGILAAETLLKVSRDETRIPEDIAVNKTAGAMDTDGTSDSPRSMRQFFPYIQAVVAFDTPFLGISPGVLAHGAEERINTASNAYKAFNTASELFGWKSPGRAVSPASAADASAKAAENTANSSGWSKWGKYAAVGGAAAAIAGATGAAYINRNQISQGIAWASSHLEFVGCLARGAELQRRVESIVELTRTHGVGFADYYTALDEKVTSRTKYAGAVLGDDRTFCVVPKQARDISSRPVGSKRDAPVAESGDEPSRKRRRSKGETEGEKVAAENEQVHEFAADTSRSKGLWVKCVNPSVSDELRAHTSMFKPTVNADYHTMLPRVRDQIVDWVDVRWRETLEDHNGDVGGAERSEATSNHDDSGGEDPT